MTLRPDQQNASRYRVELFGGPRLFYGAEEIPLSRHQRWLLAALYGSETRPVPRTTLLSWFWPTDEQPKSRRRLNQLLYSFQKKVPGKDVFLGRKDDVAVGESDVASDLSAFREHLSHSSFSESLGLLSRGFGSLVLAEAPRPFHDWMVSREAELRQELRRAAERALRTHREGEDWERAVDPAEALLKLAPGDENRLKPLLECLVKAGRKNEAEEVLDGFGSEHRSGGWTPGKELTGLLTTPEYPLAFSQGYSSGSLSLPEPPPLQGRTPERNLLRRTLASPPRTELRGILVSGEAGIGKTRLISEAIRGIPFDGQKVLHSEAAELEQLIPLNPLIEIFRPEWVGETLRGLEEPWRTVLFGVMPGHYPDVGPVPEAPQIQQGSVPRRLFEAFYRFLLALVGDGPVILVLEDLQWADETTLSVLEFLIRRWETGQLQLVLSVRGDEVRKSEALATFLENLRIHLDFLEVNLTELDPPDGEALIRHVTEDPLRQEDVTRLRSLAGGNPYFLIELTFEFLAGRLFMEDPPVDPVQVPLSIRQVLDRRFSQLSPEADRVLGALAVFSRPLEVAALEEITQLTGNECLTGLDQLYRFRFVANAGTAVTISHELVRHTVYQNLSDPRRAWLHDQIGQHLYSSPDPVPPDELAVHFHHAGVAEKAGVFATEAADRAESSGAVPEALRFLRIAREHATDPEAIATLIHRMGHLHYLHQNLDEAAPLLELAAQRFRRQGKSAEALDAEVERLDCLAQRGALTATEFKEEILNLKGEARESECWEIFQNALDVQAHQLDREGDVPAIREVLKEAKDSSDRGTQKARCMARATVALNTYFGCPEEGLASAREAVRIAGRTGDDQLILHSLNRLIIALHYRGLLHTSEGETALSESGTRLGGCGDLILKFNLRLNQAVWHLEVGELDRAQVLLGQLGSLVYRTGATDAQAKLRLNLGELKLESGERGLALSEYQKAEGLISATSPHYFRMVVIAGTGLCCLLAGELSEAKKLESQLPEFPAFWTFDPTVPVIFKTRMHLSRRDKERAFAFLESSREQIRERLRPTWLRLTLEEARLSKIHRRERVADLAELGLSMADALGLRTRTEQFKRLLESTP